MSYLEKNLTAMRGWTPGTVLRVGAVRVPEGFELVRGTDGVETFLRRQEDGELVWLGGTSMAGASAGAISGALSSGGGNGLGLSIGTGFEWAAFAKRLGGSQMVYVWEPAAELVRMALTVCDMSDFLGSGKVVIFCGEAGVAGGELLGFLEGRLGFEAPGVLHPLPSIGAERRNGLLAGGEGMVRAAVAARHGVVARLWGEVSAVEKWDGGAVAMVVGERYLGERPMHAELEGVAGLRVDDFASGGMANRLGFLLKHRPGRVMSDMFRGELGCVPWGVGVETFVPPLIGAGVWQPGRLPGAGSFGEWDRVVVCGGVHRELLMGLGIDGGRIEVRGVRSGISGNSSNSDISHIREEAVLPNITTTTDITNITRGEKGVRVVMVGDLGRTDAGGVGLELPTHVAVFEAAREIVAGEYLTVGFGSAGDILRRALLKAGVGVGAGGDPMLGDPMLRVVRDVLIPAVPLLVMARRLLEEGVRLELVGEWQGLERSAGKNLVITSFGEFSGDAGRWEGVAGVVHLSPWGLVSAVVVDGALRGVPVVSPRQVSDGVAGSLVEVLGGKAEILRPVGEKVFGVVKGLVRTFGG